MTQTTRPHPMPDFSDFISDLDNGEIERVLTAELAAVVRASEETGKMGELTLKIHVKKEGKMAIVACDVKTKVPKHPLHGTLFYVGENGELLREDPKQLPLKGLATPAPKLKTVSFPMRDEIASESADEPKED